MKLSLLNLAPLKEIEFDSPAPEGMDIPNFDSLVDALKWKNDLENYSMDLEHELKHAQRQFNDKLSGQEERGAEPEGGPIQQKIAGELNQLKAREEELKQKLNTVLAKVDYFDQNYLSENLNEEADYEGEGWDDPRDENGKLIRGEDGVISIGQLSLSGHAVKAIGRGEHPSGLTYNAIFDKKMEILQQAREDGKFAGNWSKDPDKSLRKFKDWIADNRSWGRIKKLFNTEFQEGSCGHGPDGVPGDTPGGTQGMDADDRTRGMLRMLIQKEIAKLHETK